MHRRHPTARLPSNQSWHLCITHEIPSWNSGRRNLTSKPSLNSMVASIDDKEGTVASHMDTPRRIQLIGSATSHAVTSSCHLENEKTIRKNTRDSHKMPTTLPAVVFPAVHKLTRWFVNSEMYIFDCASTKIS